jgi:heme-degrading monooxygenase HmoA
MSMTGVPGLKTQHSFFFPGVIERDPLTVSFWRDEASIRDFAYGQGSHRRQLDRHRADPLADRTSFTRFRVLHSAGTWHGHDPARP